MQKSSMVLVLGLESIVICAAARPSVAEESPTGILAAQIREQGFPCKKAENAVRDQKQSSPNNVVWTLTCEGVSYRVTLIPDMAAKVETLDNR